MAARDGANAVVVAERHDVATAAMRVAFVTLIINVASLQLLELGMDVVRSRRAQCLYAGESVPTKKKKDVRLFVTCRPAKKYDSRTIK